MRSPSWRTSEIRSAATATIRRSMPSRQKAAMGKRPSSSVITRTTTTPDCAMSSSTPVCPMRNSTAVWPIPTSPSSRSGRRTARAGNSSSNCRRTPFCSSRRNNTGASARFYGRAGLLYQRMTLANCAPRKLPPMDCLPADDFRRPGQSRSERGREHIIAAVEASAPVQFVQADADGGG